MLCVCTHKNTGMYTCRTCVRGKFFGDGTLLQLQGSRNQGAAKLCSKCLHLMGNLTVQLTVLPVGALKPFTFLYCLCLSRLL